MNETDKCREKQYREGVAEAKYGEERACREGFPRMTQRKSRKSDK